MKKRAKIGFLAGKSKACAESRRFAGSCERYHLHGVFVILLTTLPPNLFSGGEGGLSMFCCRSLRRRSRLYSPLLGDCVKSTIFMPSSSFRAQREISQWLWKRCRRGFSLTAGLFRGFHTASQGKGSGVRWLADRTAFSYPEPAQNIL